MHCHKLFRYAHICISQSISLNVHISDKCLKKCLRLPEESTEALDGGTKMRLNLLCAAHGRPLSSSCFLALIITGGIVSITMRFSVHAHVRVYPELSIERGEKKWR
jgi:hypothetical protein